MTNKIKLSPAPFHELMQDRKVRIEVARQNHFMFFNIYFSRYVHYPTANFQRDLFRLTEDIQTKNVVVVAFRGSGKTTIMTLSYPLWAILGIQQRKFVLLLSQTQNQAQQMLVNLKREIENNDILRNDFGGLEQSTDEWGRESLVIKRYNARIMAASTETSIRGVRFGEHRPDLIIADDVEDLQSVKTKDGRNKAYDWLMGDVIPAGDRDTRLIVIGNLLHEDSLLMRLKDSINANKFDGEFLQFPLLDNDEKPLWPGKFPNKKSIEKLHKTIPSEVAWQREYLLRIIATQEQVVHPLWIRYYKKIPADIRHYHYTALGVDLAISKKDTADFTAMVAAKIYGSGEDMRVYILPHPVNERLTFPEQVARARLYSDKLERARLFIEEVGYQSAIIQELQRLGYTAEGVKTHGADKQSRLAIVTHLIQNGQVLFPENGCKDLIQQLVGFGVEKHDDLADAFAVLMLKVMENNDSSESFTFIGYL
jgi:predicted phage terminase large subunit-like protein